jgi:proline iminopeptidase
MLLKDGEYRVLLNGIDHWYRVAGAIHRTTPLVILHGGPGGNVYNFERTVGPYLEAFATVVYYDQRGCGRSAPPTNPEAYSISLLINDLDRLRKELQQEQIIPLGFSFGGELALEYALTYPQHTQKVIVQAPGVGMPGRTFPVQLYGFEQVSRNEIRTRVRNIINNSQDTDKKLDTVWSIVDSETVDRLLFHKPEFAKLNRKMWQESGLTNTGQMARVLKRDISDVPLYQRVAEVYAPVLVIVGLYDRNSGVDCNRDLALTLSNARLILFDNSAHFPDIEESERYAREVQLFVFPSK